MIEQREAEATRLGRVLHDEIGQLLTAAGLQLDAFKRTQQLQSTEAIDAIQGIFEQAIEIVRELSHSLPSSMVQRVGLTFALDRLIAEYRKNSSVTIRSMLDGRAHTSPEVAIAMYRIANCSLENALKHASATLIEVMLRPTARGISLDIRDNGIGFDVEVARKSPRGIGILLMDHSAKKAGLQIGIESSEAGTIISVLGPQNQQRLEMKQS